MSRSAGERAVRIALFTAGTAWYSQRDREDHDTDVKEISVTPRHSSAFRTPTGTEGFHLEEAYLHRMVTRTLEDLFLSRGYLPVQIPEFDFFDTYRTLFDEGHLNRIYRFVDREGDLLMLRSDMTLFLARHLGLNLGSGDLPLRVCYADSILRHENREDISRNEFFQIGAELAGLPGTAGDSEILGLQIEAFAELGLSGIHLHVGSRAVVDGFTGSLDDADRNCVISSIMTRSFEDLPRLLGGLPSEGKALLLEILPFIGTPSEFEPLRQRIETAEFGSEEKKALLYPAETVSRLRERYPGTEILIDFSEVGAQPYYTGLVFRAYLDGMDSAVSAGGRYDTLLAHFGFDCPSTGFSMLLRKLEPLLASDPRFTVRNAAGKTANREAPR